MTRQAAFVRRLVVVVLAIVSTTAVSAAADRRPLGGTVELLLGLDVRPFAIGHRGSGANGGASQPIENTIPAVRGAFVAGLSVVEVDVQLTADREVAVFHEDFLPDFTCLNRLTLAELQDRLPHVPSLQAVLKQVRRFNQEFTPLRGLVIVDLKAASPLCDSDDTQEEAMVVAVTQVIRQMGMTDQALIASFSPALLFLAWSEAADIARALTVSGLQFLSASAIEEALSHPDGPRIVVTPIDKRLDLGLRWAEIGVVFRLPGYASDAELFATAAIVGARVVEADSSLLALLGGSGFVGALQAAGLKVFGWTAANAADWSLFEAAGVDAIYVDDVALGVARQAPIP